MILYRHGQSSDAGGEGRLFRDGPAFENAVFFESEIVVEVGGIVFLDDVDSPLAFGVSFRFWCCGEVPFLLVVFESHAISSFIQVCPIHYRLRVYKVRIQSVH